jgi:hypothetical protein
VVEEVDRRRGQGDDEGVLYHCFAFVLLVASVAAPALAGDRDFRIYDSKYYVIHTDLPEIEAREAQLRMTRMAEEYLRGSAGFSGEIKERLPFYLYKNLADYTAAVGVEGSGGFFDGDKLMATTLRTPAGEISGDTWHIVQHEGFHQFAHAAIAGEIPMWADEGLAEYFGQAIFTGDGFVAGLIPQARLVRVRALLKDAGDKPLEKCLALSREEWNAKVEMSNYDLAWSFVHFLMHGEEGKLRKSFDGFVHDIGRGEAPAKAYDRHFNSTPNLQRRYRDWWVGLGDNPTAQNYNRATLSILTSFLARGRARGERFSSFDDLVKTPAGRLAPEGKDWLPEALFKAAVADAAQMRAGGNGFELIESGERAGSILLRRKDGTKLVGRFSVGEAGHIDAVGVEASK